MEDINTIPDLRFVHLKVETDKDNNIIYSRKINEGPGKKFYGIEIAKGLGFPDNLVKEALIVRKKIINEAEFLVCSNVSRYNSNVRLTQCEICNKKYNETLLHVHHIIFQKYANEQGLVNGRTHKNTTDNLVVLCALCHQNVHKGEITINGWMDSTAGKKLDFELN